MEPAHADQQRVGDVGAFEKRLHPGTTTFLSTDRHAAQPRRQDMQPQDFWQRTNASAWLQGKYGSHLRTVIFPIIPIPRSEEHAVPVLWDLHKCRCGTEYCVHFLECAVEFQGICPCDVLRSSHCCTWSVVVPIARESLSRNSLESYLSRVRYLFFKNTNSLGGSYIKTWQQL